MTGQVFPGEYPYRDAYLLREARLFRAELTIPSYPAGRINRTTMDLAIRSGFEFNATASGAMPSPTWSIGSRPKAARCGRRAHTAISACTRFIAALTVQSAP